MDLIFVGKLRVPNRQEKEECSRGTNRRKSKRTTIKEFERNSATTDKTTCISRKRAIRCGTYDKHNFVKTRGIMTREIIDKRLLTNDMWK